MNAHFTEVEAIKKLIDKYIKGAYEADIPALKEVFHEKATMSGFLGDEMLIATPEAFFADLASKPSMASQNVDYKGVILDLHVTGKIADVSLLVENFFGAVSIEDKFHLLKLEGGWKIINKTFTTIG